MAACISRCNIRASPIWDSSSCHGSPSKICTLLLRWHDSAAEHGPASLCLEAGFLCA